MLNNSLLRRKEDYNEKITSLVLALVLSLSLSVTAFASELPTDQSNDVVSIITVADENGNDVQYELRKDTVTDIPIYAVKEGDVSRSYTHTATLTIGINSEGKAVFIFTPSNVAIALITVGFTGEISTYYSGIKYGYNPYILPVLTGWAYAPASGTGSLSGTYSVLGYENASVLEGFSW